MHQNVNYFECLKCATNLSEGKIFIVFLFRTSKVVITTIMSLSVKNSTARTIAAWKPIQCLEPLIQCPKIKLGFEFDCRNYVWP